MERMNRRRFLKIGAGILAGIPLLGSSVKARQLDIHINAKSCLSFNKLSWTNPTDPDFSHMEIWVSRKNKRDEAHILAVFIGLPGSNAEYIHTNIERDADYHYWLAWSSVNTPGLKHWMMIGIEHEKQEIR